MIIPDPIFGVFEVAAQVLELSKIHEHNILEEKLKYTIWPMLTKIWVCMLEMLL